MHSPSFPYDNLLFSLQVILFVGFRLVLGLILPLLFTWALYLLLTLPLRRTERARHLLDLLELGLKNGRSPEMAILEAAWTQDRSLGVRFQRLSARLGDGHGVRLSEALALVPLLVPDQIRGMLAAGERIGDIRRVLPACRLLLRDSVSQVRGALNYLLIIGTFGTPLMVLIPIVLRVKVIPIFSQVFKGMDGDSQLPAFTQWVFGTYSLITLLQFGLAATLATLVISYLGGPRLRLAFAETAPSLADGLVWGLPWRRKRLQRDFSALLAVLLDAGMPEAEAVRLAGSAMANTLVQRRADQAAAQLAQGIALPDALKVLDGSGELRWRIANAAHGRSGFMSALAGWHQALDAKAFQLEQTAAQLATTGFVLYNGLVIACIFIGMFIALISLINRAVLW